MVMDANIRNQYGAMTNAMSFPQFGPTMWLSPAEASRYIQIVAARNQAAQTGAPDISPADLAEMMAYEARAAQLARTMSRDEQARYLAIQQRRQQLAAAGEPDLGAGDLADLARFEGRAARLATLLSPQEQARYAQIMARRAELTSAGQGDISAQDLGELNQYNQWLDAGARLPQPEPVREDPMQPIEPPPSPAQNPPYLTGPTLGGTPIAPTPPPPTPTPPTPTPTPTPTPAPPPKPNPNMFGYAGRHVPGIPTLADPHVLDDPTLGYEPEHPPGWTPPASIAAMSTPLISPPGQQASAEHFNYQPMGDGSWTMYPPGVQAPAWGPQGSFPDMASSEQLQIGRAHV